MARLSPKQVSLNNKGDISRLPIPERGSTIYWDESMPGFGVKVFSSGARSFVARYWAGRRQHEKTIGKASKISLKDAKKIAKEIFGDAAGGGNPVQEARDARARLTFSAWADTYGEEIKVTKKSWRDDVNKYLPDAKKRFGQMSLQDITRDHIRMAMTVVSEGDTKRPKTNHWLASVRACLQEALRRGFISHNPAMGIKELPTNPPRRRVLDPDEQKGLVEALNRESEETRLAFDMLINTGARTSEVLQAQWGNIEWENQIWHLPKTKAGKPQAISLPKGLFANLRRRFERFSPSDSDFIIPGRGGQKRYGLTSAWNRIKKTAELKDDLHIHDIRRTYGLKVYSESDLVTTKAVLRHSDVRTTANVYIPLGAEHLKEAVEKVAMEVPGGE